ncbi:MAG: SAF domain-containing protein [Bifidobacterium sp.]|jgi:hypothetical protein|nr:SAF domain-containing protein [Bifidobacterium sp.]
MANLLHIRNRRRRTGPSRVTLRRRRILLGLRRVLIALMVGLCVLFGLQAVLSSHQTQDIVVAVHALKAGARIRAADITTRQIPADGAWFHAARSSADVVGLYAQIDIEAGQPIVGTMARAPPLAPKGTTVIRVQLAGDPSRMHVGDTVSLASTAGCDATQVNGDGICVIAELAVVMGPAVESSDGTRASVPLALSPRNATQALAAQEAGWLMAVAR